MKDQMVIYESADDLMETGIREQGEGLMNSIDETVLSPSSSFHAFNSFSPYFFVFLTPKGNICRMDAHTHRERDTQRDRGRERQTETERKKE